MPDLAPVATAVFRVDASREIGGGHVMRCIALAQALAAEGWECRFATTDESVKSVPALLKWPRLVLAPEHWRDASALQKILPQGCDLLVIDHYGLDAAYEAAFRGRAKTILAIDDLARPHESDIVLDQTFGRSPESYRGRTPPGCKLLLGASFALLRPEFSKLRQAALARRKQTTAVRRILVSFGATDPTNATGIALRALAGVDADIDVVLGADAPHLEEIRALVSAMPRARLHVNTSDMAALTMNADIAVAAPSSASWERCCLGLPSLLLVTADNQQATAQAIAKAGAAYVTDKSRLADDFQRLLRSSAERFDMAHRAALVCDGLGAYRVLSELSPALAQDTPVILRPATNEDGSRMLAWQRHPSVRAFARNPRAPDETEHLAWLTRTLTDPNCLLAIIEHGGKAVGVLRLDSANDEGRRQVSIYLDPALHGRGVGKAALRQLRRLVPHETFEATVLAGNEPSARLFAAAGYSRQADGLFISEPAHAA